MAVRETRPGLEPGLGNRGSVPYTQAAAGRLHTVLLQSDGCAIAFEMHRQSARYQLWSKVCRIRRCPVARRLNSKGQYNIPALEEGTSYIQVAARLYPTALLRSDEVAITHGRDSGGQCLIPSLDGGLHYTSLH